MTLLEELLRLNEHFQQEMDTLGLTPIQAGVMLYLHRHSDVGFLKIADTLGLQPTYLALVLQELAQKRLIRRKAHSKDGEIIWALTRKGAGLAPDISKYTLELSTAIREVSLHPHHA